MVEAEALEKYKIIQGNIKRSKVLILEYRDNLILAVVWLKKKVKKKWHRNSWSSSAKEMHLK